MPLERLLAGQKGLVSLPGLVLQRQAGTWTTGPSWCDAMSTPVCTRRWWPTDQQRDLLQPEVLVGR